jgi:hypothetical protein
MEEWKIMWEMRKGYKDSTEKEEQENTTKKQKNLIK